MGKVFLVVIIFAAVAWSFFAGYQLLDSTENPNSPNSFFCEDDEAVLLLNRVSEMKNTEIYQLFNKNPLLSSISIIDWSKIEGNTIVYVSKNNAKAVIAKNKNWRPKEIELIEGFLRQNNVVLNAQKEFISISIGGNNCKNGAKIPFHELDKKASANLWEITNDTKWRRTDVYALNTGYTEYSTVFKNSNFGEAINDVAEFALVLPQSIEKYEFFERFYAKEKDSIFASSVMFNWINKGFVKGNLNGETFLVTDYQAQQNPSLILLEKSESEDSVRMDKQIKSFIGFELTSDFPSRPLSRIYTLEIDNLCIITESKSLAENLYLLYNLGETLGLNEKKSNEFFKGLPTLTNYRLVNNKNKRSVTQRNNTLFEVAMTPPMEDFSSTSATNWTYNSGFSSISGFVPIADHIRGGNSLFVYNENGKYALIDRNGRYIWGGNLEEKILNSPMVVDIYENDKLQLLFATPSKIFLLDLNGENVASFPYSSEHELSSKISTLKWKNTIRILAGTSKGEVIMLGNSGKELNIVQIGSHPIKISPKALNLTGNLRVWVANTNDEKYLGYLETPAKAELLGKTTANHFLKAGSNVFGIVQEENDIFLETMRNESTSSFAKGKVIQLINELVILQTENELQAYDAQRKLISSQKLPFKEVGAVNLTFIGEQKFWTVFDYLENNVYLFLPNGDLAKGFPKEGRAPITTSYDKQANSLVVYTTLNSVVIAYMVDFSEI